MIPPTAQPQIGCRRAQASVRLNLRLAVNPGTTPLTDTTAFLGTNVNLAGAGQMHSPSHHEPDKAQASAIRDVGL